MNDRGKPPAGHSQTAAGPHTFYYNLNRGPRPSIILIVCFTYIAIAIFMLIEQDACSPLRGAGGHVRLTNGCSVDASRKRKAHFISRSSCETYSAPAADRSLLCKFFYVRHFAISAVQKGSCNFFETRLPFQRRTSSAISPLPMIPPSLLRPSTPWSLMNTVYRS